MKRKSNQRTMLFKKVYGSDIDNGVKMAAPVQSQIGAKITFSKNQEIFFC